MNRAWSGVIAAFATIGLLACGGGGPAGGGPPPPPPPPQPSPPVGTVTINLTADLRFDPEQVTIDPGTNVRWVYQGGEPHTITPREPAQTGVWNRAAMNDVGQTFEHVFEVSGETYDYFCEPHELNGMTGTIIVR